MTEDRGRRIGDRYELIEPLGEGGMGVVWRARDHRLQRAVAVKLLSAAMLGSDVARSRLVREARAAAALEHEGIIRVYDVGETDDGGAFLVMELIRGRSLRSALRAGDLSLARRADVLVVAARALAFAHAAGIVHRDVKPDNVMLREDGRVALVDFGIAKPVSSEVIAHAETVTGGLEASLTAAGQLVGTPAYLAPEQARGEVVGPAADQFALAVTAWECFAGALPWKGATVADVVAAVLRDDVPPVSARAAVPAEVDAVLARALAKEPAARYPDLDAFADALSAATAALDRSAQPTPKRSSVPAPSVTAASTTAGQAKAAASGAGAGWHARSALLAIVLGGLAVAAFVASPRGGAKEQGRDEPIACPSLAVKGIDEPWLGTAAAALACERIQIARGGADARTLVPAELLDAPREIGPSYPPLDAPREATLAAAKTRTSRTLDGALEKQGGGYAVHLVLRTKAGDVAQGDGRGVEIYEAVREAMKPILAALGPLTAAERASLESALDVGSEGAALDLLDLRTAGLIEDRVAVAAECKNVERRSDLGARAGYLARAACARWLRTGKLQDPPPPLDAATPTALLTSTLAQGASGEVADVAGRAARLEDAAEKATEPELRARLFAGAAEVYHLVGDARARPAARRALSSSPKAFDWRTSGWHRLLYVSDGDAALQDAAAAWHPWEPVSQSPHTPRGQVPEPSVLLKHAGRTYLLSLRGHYASAYGELLIDHGRLEEARGIAQLQKDDLLDVKLLLGQSQYGAALAAVQKLLASLPADDASAALAFQLATAGVRAALVLERPADFVVTMVDRWVTAEPPHIVDGIMPFVSLVNACMFAPRDVATRCLERIKGLRASGRIPTIFNGADVVVNGASLFVAEDFAGAARTWRTLLRSGGWYADPLREAMARAFERAGDHELAEEVDAMALSLVGEPRTAELAWVRGAKRAEARGDKERARQLAKAVVDRWRFADEDVPAVAQMKALLARLGG